VLFEGLAHGDPITAEVLARWDEEGGVNGAYPVLGDPSGAAVLEAIPEWEGHTPTQCVLSPEMELVYCWGSRVDTEAGYDSIVAHYESSAAP
jgi:hypothetical protein